MQNFLTALEQLKQIDPKTAFDQIFRLFHTIGGMDQQTVIAAFQTFQVFCDSTGISIREKSVDPIRKALISRMVALHDEASPERRDALAHTFYMSTDCAARPILFKPLKEVYAN